MIEGIDVSFWQSTTPSFAGMAFLVARATYGISPDTRYAMHIANARKAGLVTGAYCFGRGIEDPAAQAASFVATAGDVDLLVLDLERDGANVSMTNAQASAFIAAVQATGRRCGLYHSESGFPELGQDFNWIAKWTASPPSVHWDIWQYQGSPLDRDRFDGTADDLRALGRGVAVKAITDETPATMTVAAGTQLYDLDGTTPWNVTGGKWATTTPGRPSPYGAGTQRAMFVTEPGKGRRLVLVTPVAGSVAPVKPAGGFTQADLDKTKADTKAAAVAAVAAI